MTYTENPITDSFDLFSKHIQPLVVFEGKAPTDISHILGISIGGKYVTPPEGSVIDDVPTLFCEFGELNFSFAEKIGRIRDEVVKNLNLAVDRELLNNHISSIAELYRGLSKGIKMEDEEYTAEFVKFRDMEQSDLGVWTKGPYQQFLKETKELLLREILELGRIQSVIKLPKKKIGKRTDYKTFKFKEKLGITKDSEGFVRFTNCLISKNFILKTGADDLFKIFENKTKPKEKIIWKGAKGALYYLIYRLNEKEVGLVEHLSNPWQVAADCFIYPEEEVIDSDGLGSLGMPGDRTQKKLDDCLSWIDPQT